MTRAARVPTFRGADDRVANMSKLTLLLTTTGEPYQPVRLKWTVPGKAYCLPRLRTLRCVGLDAETNALSLWLSAEAEHLKLGDALGFPQPMPTPLAGRLVILGIFRFPDSASMVLEVRSIPRAIALAQLLRPVLGEKAKLTRLRVINRWFEARESADDLLNLDKCLDRNVTVIRWEETADELDAVVARGKTPEERMALWEAWRDRRRHIDVPLVEDFPCHPEEENAQMGDLANTLNFRFVRAGRVWGGERVTLQQVIEETFAKAPALPVPGIGGQGER